MSSLLSRLELAAEGHGIVTFVGSAASNDRVEHVEWARVHEDARSMAAALQGRGIGNGDHVAVLGTTTQDVVTAVQAIWLAGGVLVMLPLPMRLRSIEEFAAQTRRRIRDAHAILVLVDSAVAPFLEARPGDAPSVVLGELKGDAGRYVRPPDSADALAILQFTSGSTAEPKGVMLPHRCVTANIDAIDAVIRVDPDTDRGVSWLPLYHDMGLVGLLGIPMTKGADLVLGAPQDFLASPARWMEWMSEFRGTITAAPSFAYALAARALRRLVGLDLSRWRLALNGAEPIDPAAVEAFCDAGTVHGFNPRSVSCVFGLAEATLAVTFPEPGGGMTTDGVKRRVLEVDRYAAPASPDERESDGIRRLPLLGRPLPDTEVRVTEPATGAVMRDREVGEVEVRGSAVMPGYFRQRQATHEAFRDGWLRTGDLGYLLGGELVLCGRLRDVIIVGGRNVFPEDIERAAASVEGVRAGNVIAFGTDGSRGREALIVVAETKLDDAERVRGALAVRVTDAVGVRPEDVVLVRPGSLPKTSSGKLQRSLCRNRYLDGALDPV